MAKRIQIPTDLKDATDLSELVKGLEKVQAEQDQAGDRPVPARETAAKPVAAAPANTGKAVLLGAVLGVVIMAMIVVLFVLPPIINPFTRKVPAVIGNPTDVAHDAVLKTGLTPRFIYDPGSKKPAGTVIAVAPPAGSKLKKGETVKLTIAGKPPRITPKPLPSPDVSTPGAEHHRPVIVPTPAVEKVAVPEVVGLAEDAARKALESRGLKPVVTIGAPGEKPGLVLTCAPKTGALVERKSEVMLVVSAAPAATVDGDLVTVENYAGKNGIDAVNELRAKGLAVWWLYEVTRLQPNGYVIRTDPPAGSKLPLRSKITVIIAKQ